MADEEVVGREAVETKGDVANPPGIVQMAGPPHAETCGWLSPGST